MNNIGTVILETERLILRKISLADAQSMYNNWATDEKVCRYLSWEKHSSLDVTKSVISKWINMYNEEHNYFWIVIIKETNEPIGTISVVKKIIVEEVAEIGYGYGSKWWGKGYASEALGAVIDFLLNTVGFTCIQAFHKDINPASGRVMEKAGMIKDTVLHNCRIDKFTGKRCDLVCYYILKT